MTTKQVYFSDQYNTITQLNFVFMISTVQVLHWS